MVSKHRGEKSSLQCSILLGCLLIFLILLRFLAQFSVKLGLCQVENVKKYYPPHTHKRQLDVIRGNMSMEVSPTPYKNTVHLRVPYELNSSTPWPPNYPAYARGYSVSRHPRNSSPSSFNAKIHKSHTKEVRILQGELSS